MADNLVQPSRSRLWRLWQYRFKVPLSPLGALVLATSAWIYYSYGAGEADFVLHSAALVGALLVGLSIVGVMIASWYLWVRIHRVEFGPDLELESGVTSASGFTYPTLARWPLIEVRLTWVTPPEIEVEGQPIAGANHEIVRARRRGLSTDVWRRFVVSDIFGLARFGLDRHVAQRLRILPSRSQVTAQVIEHLRGGDALSHPAGPADGELLDMRRYVHGDPLRRVLWKVYGRTRELLVRAPEQAVNPNPSAAAYMVAGPNDEATASAARFFLEQGLLGDDFLFGADGTTKPLETVHDALDAIVGSANHRDRGGADLESFLDHIDQRRRLSCVLFLPPVLGPWLAHVERLAARMPSAIAVIALDGEMVPERVGWVRRKLCAPPGTRRIRVKARLPHVVKRAESCGLAVRVLHRPTGQLIATSQVMAWVR